MVVVVVVKSVMHHVVVGLGSRGPGVQGKVLGGLQKCLNRYTE